MRIVAILLALSLGVALLLVPSAPTHACGNAVYEVKSHMVRALKRAEGFVEEGKLKTAIDKVRHFRFNKKKRRAKSAKRSRSRGTGLNSVKGFLKKRDRLVSLAIVRSQGKIDKRGRKVRKKKAQAANLESAAEALRQPYKPRRASDTPSPRYRAFQAEALAVTPEGSTRALDILMSLDSAELMPSAWSYATLARLQHARGETKLRDEALARCKTMSSKPRRVCPRF